MATFSERLRSLRKNYGLSQQKLADEIGYISKSSINMYERGQREPGLETMEAFADFFNVDIDYLYGKSDIPNRAKETGFFPACDFVITPHERKLILAYRSNPSMQEAVDRLLQIRSEGDANTRNA